MTATFHFKKSALIITIITLMMSCKPEVHTDANIGTFTAVSKSPSGYELMDNDLVESITISRDSIYHKEPMEDVKFKIDHIKQEGRQTTYYPEKYDKSYYKFSWIDQQKGIAVFEINIDGNAIQRYFVNEANLSSIKKAKPSQEVKITEEKTGDIIKDSLKIDDGSKTLYIEDEDCILIRNAKGEQLYERCFEDVMLRLRAVKGNLLPLTFISGSKSIDLDFIAAGKDWVSNSATLYEPSTNGERKVTRPLIISVKDFTFDAVASKFDD